MPCLPTGVEEFCRTLRGGGSKQRASRDNKAAKQQQEMEDNEEEEEAGKEESTDGDSGGGSDGSVDDGMLDAFARFRGEEKECKFIIVTGEWA